jgi:hypothetical protein
MYNALIQPDIPINKVSTDKLWIKTPSMDQGIWMVPPEESYSH